MWRLYVLLAMPTALLLCGCPTIPPGPSPLKLGELGHADSGILFPEDVVGFTRGQIRAYDQAARDVGVEYNLVNSTNSVAITVYIYPGPKLVSFGSPREVREAARRKLTNDHFQHIIREVQRAHPEGALLSESDISMEFRGQALYGRSAIFKSTERFAYRIQPVVLMAEVFAFGNWIIKIRGTYPMKTSAQGKLVIESFKTEFCRINERASRQEIQGE